MTSDRQRSQPPVRDEDPTSSTTHATVLPETSEGPAPAERRGSPWLLAGVAVFLLVVAILSSWLLPHGDLVAVVSVLVLLVLVTGVRPQWALFLFIVGLPLHNVLMAWLFHATASIAVVKLAQVWKELVLAVALVRVAAPPVWRRLRQPAANHRQVLRATPLDIAVALFALLCAVSVLLPSPVVTISGRLYGFRDLVMPLGAFAVGRLASLSRRELRIVVGLVAVVAAAFGLGAIGERAFWGNGLLLAVGYGTYISTFLGQHSPLPNNTPFTLYTGSPLWLPRAGSLALGPLDVSNLVLIALPLLLMAMTQLRPQDRRVARVALGASVLLAGAALVLAWGRESMVLVLLELVLFVAFARPRWQWKPVLLALAGCALGAVLFFSVATYVVTGKDATTRFELANQGLVVLVQSGNRGVGLGRVSGAVVKQSAGSQNASSVSHFSSLVQLAKVMARRPLGYGIGASGQVGSRFTTNPAVAAALSGETSYLTVGVDLGIVGLLVYLAMFGGAIVACWHAARSRLPGFKRAVFAGVGIAWLAIALDGIFAEVTLDLFAMYVLWWMTGAAVTLVQQHRGPGVVAQGSDAQRERTVVPLRVAIDGQCLQTARTGVRTYVDELTRRFARHDDMHRVVLLRGPRRLPGHIRAYRIVNQVLYLFWLQCWLPVSLWLRNFDVLWSPEYLTPMWTPVPRVVTFQDALFLRRPQDYNRLWLQMFRWVTLPAIRRSDAVIVPSAYTAAEAIEYGRIPKERIHIVPLAGPRTDEPLPVDETVAEETLARFRLETGAYVLHVGVLERRKNLPVLVKAFDLWRQQGAPANVKLVLVGQPGPRPDLDDSGNIRQVVAELGLEDRVVFTNHVTAEQRDTLYRRALAVVIPSVFEGFGIPVLEAFAARVPVVASRASSLPEVAGSAALLCDPSSPEEFAECLARLESDPKLREQLVRAGEDRVRVFSWERTARETLAVLDDAVALSDASPQTAQWQGA